MAFGITREELQKWKRRVKSGKIAFLTHYWQDDRFPNCYSVTKVGCNDTDKLIAWGHKHNLKAKWIHYDKEYPHFDLFGEKQIKILLKEKKFNHIERFNLHIEKHTGR